MRSITFFHLPHCPYCANARRAVEELVSEHPEYAAVTVEPVDETDPPADLAGTYDYYYVPTMYVGEDKVFEAHPGETYEEIKADVARAFEMAVKS